MQLVQFGGLLCIVNLLFSVLAGVLYVYFAQRNLKTSAANHGVEEILDQSLMTLESGAAGGALAGFFAGLFAHVVNTMLSFSIAASGLLDNVGFPDQPTGFLAGTYVFTLLFGICQSGFSGLILGAIGGAIGSRIWGDKA